MTIARLDNEVFFKKAFTDRIVFKAFVKDIIGIDVEPTEIETEKAFVPKVGNVNFKYDIFADDPTNRLIIEIQKVEYDHNFDRFLHYHLQAIIEQQRTSADYSVDRTVYTIVVMTSRYKYNQKTGQIIEDEVLISSLNPRNLKGIEKDIFGHNLIFLNPNYKDESTPENYRDWLDLIYESIHHPENPSINTNKEGIKRAAELVQFENISPDEWEQSKIDVGKRKVLTITFEEGLETGIERQLILSVLGMIKLGILTDEQIASALNITIEKVNEIRKEHLTNEI
jgi:PD-(D/E)XK nuclease family transposase